MIETSSWFSLGVFTCRVDLGWGRLGTSLQFTLVIHQSWSTWSVFIFQKEIGQPRFIRKGECLVSGLLHSLLWSYQETPPMLLHLH